MKDAIFRADQIELHVKISFFLTIVLSFSFAANAQLEYAKQVLDSLCSDRYDGRGYVNNGDNRAADFIVRELKNLGVEKFPDHDFTQAYSFNVNTFPNAIELVLGDDTLIPGADYLVHPYSGTAQGNFEVIEINETNFESVYKSAVDLSGAPKNQSIYAFNFTSLQDKTLKAKIHESAIKTMKYFPVIWVETSKQMYSVGRGQFNYPLFSIDSAAYKSVEIASIKVTNRYVPSYKTKNVIGYIPGKKKKKYIVLSAHFDHLGRMGASTIFPGANDNASGVSMLLSLAKYFKENQPQYSIVLCFFSGEEAGLEGSKYFVSHPYFKLSKTKFVLNIDIMGSASDGITVVNGTEHEKSFDKLVGINSDKDYIPQIKKRGPTANSDHYFFSQAGVPAFFIYSMGSVKNYHDIYDTSENTPLDNFDAVQKLLLDFISTI